MGRDQNVAIVVIVLLIAGLGVNFAFMAQSTEPSVDLKANETMMDSAPQNAFLTQFYENIGQVNNRDVMFYGRIPGGMIGFGASMIHLWMEGAGSCVFLSFVGAANVTPTGIDEVSRHTSYILGDRGTYTGIRGYSQITYEHLWPGIDLYYHATADDVKYEFHVAPGGNPNDIRVRCEGHDSLVIGESTVCVSKDNGTFVDEGLRAFQDLTDINVTFSSYGPHSFGVKVGDYDESKELAIMPMPGREYRCRWERGLDIAVDSSGNAFVTGYTESLDFPTMNAYNSTHGGDGDCFVFKLSANGSTLLYSTFVGGAGYDCGNSIAVDSSGNVFVTGYTNSSDFPTLNAYNSTHGGDEDCFVFKLSANGSTLLYSTFIGEKWDDRARSIAVDSSGNAFVTGRTDSRDFPTLNAYDSTWNEASDCFVFKLSPNGSTLLYSTFVGSGAYDDAQSIVVDSSGNAFVTGRTDASDFPTVNAYCSTFGSNTDCFVFKLSANGSTLLYSTFVGGGREDEGTSVALDSSGNAVVTGFTSSYDFPTLNAFNSTHRGGRDCFVFKLSANGSTLLYSTFVGGRELDEALSVAVDSSGNALVAGDTVSSDFPTMNAYNSTHGGEFRDCFVFKLSANGSTLLYSTFIGGTYTDRCYSMTVDSSGNAFVTGCASSSDFPTVNAYDSIPGGGMNCFVFKLSADGSALTYSTFVGDGLGSLEDIVPSEDIYPLVLLLSLVGLVVVATVVITRRR